MTSLSGSCAMATLMIGLATIPTAIPEEAEPQGDVRYLVKFRTFHGAASATTSAGGRVAREIARQKIVAVYLSEQGLRILRNNPNVEYVEVDQRRYPLGPK